MKFRNQIAVALLLTYCGVIHATEVFCVDSVSEFNAAYATADEENVEIRMVTGSYNMTDSCIDMNDTCDVDDDIIVRGGYAPGCGSRVRDATATVLTRPGGGLTFYTAGSAASGNGDLLLESLTFRNVPQGISIGLEQSLNPDAGLTMRRVWIDQSGRVDIFKTSTVTMLQSMITRSSGGCAVSIETDLDDGGFLERVTLQHVTIADSNGDGLCIGANSSDDLSEVTIYNSILWDNAGDDLVFEHPQQVPVHLYNNTYASLDGGVSGSVSGTLSANPQFVSPATGNFELGGSTSVNSAFPLANSANDFDMKGDARVFSIAADRGALESAIGSTATTLTVTNTSDSGLGSLRQALLDANLSPSFNRIEFDIGSSCGPKVINIMSALPAISTALHIDGYTQPGAARNTQTVGNNGQICIVLRQGNGSSAIAGLVISSSADPDISLQVEGLGFSNFLANAISLAGGNSHSILGSQFGGNIDAVDLQPSGYGVTVVSNAIGVQIGGPDPGDRNTFGEAVAAAISLTGSFGEFASQALVQNNYIGLAPDGETALPNDRGIVIYGDNHEVRDNVISANDGVGILIDGSNAHDNLIRNNVIGLVDGRCMSDCARGNGVHGIHVSDGATRNTIRENTIAHNGGDGVAVTSASGNPVFANSMFDNDGEGIDLGDDSLTLNDNDSVAAPAGAGNLDQNYPMLTAAGGTAAVGSVSGTLASVNAWYRLDFYGVATCPGFLQFNQGADRLYSHHVQITNGGGGSDGSTTFSNLAIARTGVGNYFATPRYIVATATRMTGNPLAGGKPRHTSEFGPCRAYAWSTTLFLDGFE